MSESAGSVDSVLAELDRKARAARKKAAVTLGVLALCGALLLVWIFWQIQRETERLAQLRETNQGLETTIGNLKATRQQLADEVAALGETVRRLAPASPAPNAPPPLPAAAKLPRRVYIHIADENQRASAGELSRMLYKSGFVPPGTEKVSNAPSRTVIKFFREEDRAGAEEIAALMKESGTAVQVQYLARFADRVRPGHFEVWYGREQ